MDLNQLLYHQQVALMNAAISGRDLHCGSRFDMVKHYERRIRALRHKLGVSQYPQWVHATAD